MIFAIFRIYYILLQANCCKKIDEVFSVIKFWNIDKIVTNPSMNAYPFTNIPVNQKLICRNLKLTSNLILVITYTKETKMEVWCSIFTSNHML